VLGGHQGTEDHPIKAHPLQEEWALFRCETESANRRTFVRILTRDPHA
jgi:hypothetical protein